MQDYEHTRKHPRKPVKLRVHCVGNGLYFSDTTANLSEGGVGLEMVPKIKPGEKLCLEFYTPDTGKIVIETEVVWVDGDDNKRCATGLRFKELTPEQKNGINYHLKAYRA